MGLVRLIVSLAAGFAAGRALERRWVRPRVTPAPSRLVMPTRVMVDEAVPERWHGRALRVDGPGGTSIAATVHGPDRLVEVPTSVSVPTLVLVHGWRCDVRAWHRQVTELAVEHTVVAIDLPGHGHSTEPDSGAFTLDLLGDGVRDALTAIVPEGPVVLAGHSLGGMALLNALGRHPHLAERTAGVVLASTAARASTGRLVDDPPQGDRSSPWPDLGTLGRLDALTGRLEPALHSRTAERVAGAVVRQPTDLFRLLIRAMGVGPGASEDVVAFTERLLLDADPRLLLRLVADIAALDEDAGLEVIRRRRIPTTVIVGSRDRMTPPRASRRMAQLTGADLVELADIGHFLLVEAPDALVEVLARHLRAAATHTGRPATGGGT